MDGHGKADLQIRDDTQCSNATFVNARGEDNVMPESQEHVCQEEMLD